MKVVYLTFLLPFADEAQEAYTKRVIDQFAPLIPFVQFPLYMSRKRNSSFPSICDQMRTGDFRLENGDHLINQMVKQWGPE